MSLLRSRRKPPPDQDNTAATSATIDSAISSGASLPVSSPAGANRLSEARFEIERSIFAQLCEQSRHDVSSVRVIQRIGVATGQKPMERKNIAAEIVIHYYGSGLRIASKILPEFDGCPNLLDHPPKSCARVG